MATLAGADQLAQPPSGDAGGNGGKAPGGVIVPQQGAVVAEQSAGIGRYSRALTPFSFDLSVAHTSDQRRGTEMPGNSLMIFVAQGGAIPADARISIGGSPDFPLVEGFSYDVDEPFSGFSIYNPTPAPGITVWILLAYNSPPASFFRKLTP